jgi:electron transfer flavoprotein alpha subunit
MAILVLAEHANTQLNDATARAVTAAKAIGGDIAVLVAGSGCKAAAEAAAKLDGVGKVLVVDAPHLANQLAEDVAAVIVQQMGGYDTAIAPATASGKNVMPRVAALLDVMQISDITAVKGADTFERPIYAGNAIQTVQSGEAKKIITVRTSAFSAVGGGGSATIEEVSAPDGSGLSKFEKAELTKSDRPELTSARIVVSGGRGLGSAENFQTHLAPVVDKLGAAMGASRAAVDSGFVPNDLQVGQTGKIVAPELYVAVGISGQIQHLAGMKDSKVIVAINKDEEAPIFQVADYGLVADLFEALPALQTELDKAGK